MIKIDEMRDFVRIAQQEIDHGVSEDKLRHLLSTRLSVIFPESPWWIQEHALGSETYLHFSNLNGKARTGFADSVVGKTAIEYEKNLTITNIFEEGYRQVKEYCAALCNLGISEHEVYGILSDTVRWYGYTVAIPESDGRKRLYGANDIELTEQDYVDLSRETDVEFQKFEVFVTKYLEREQSGILTAKTLALHFGVDSKFYKDQIADYRHAVSLAMEERPEYGDLIKHVWQDFVAYLGASDYGAFSEETYINEFYLVTVAKVICANILNEAPMLCTEDEIKKIINGNYFSQRNILNLVDYDYFGWLNHDPYVNLILDSVIKMQKLLIHYDYKFIAEEDLFGELLAQLSHREHRLLLGQDFTPHWVAKDVVRHILKEGNEEPRILDMCCGSGVFLIEAIKEVRKKYAVSARTYDQNKDNMVFSCVMGFDIDPLAVMLAKVNWVLSMRDLFDVHTGTVTIPVYHADSLFAATPITHQMPKGSGESYILHFCGSNIEIPAYMVTPEHRKTFDAFMSKCYKFAMARAAQKESELTSRQLDNIIDAIASETDMEQTLSEIQAQRHSAYHLILQLERLQREGKNGIWYFILSNSYKPELVTNQFNCIISNPPWLAMSKLADNPYRKVLQEKTEEYGIKPPGSAHLHMELATTFLLASIDKYLKDGAKWICVMPGSLLSGFNHDPMRLEAYRTSNSPVNACIDTIWELPVNTFKNKAIVLGGTKTERKTIYPVSGRLYDENNEYKICSYTLNRQGNRSAWTNRGSTAQVVDLVNAGAAPFYQGADLFPRTALFHTYVYQANGTWSVRTIEKTSDLYYLISESKKNICNLLEGDGFSDKYLYDCLISKHLSPFIVAKPAKVIIPAFREDGCWKTIDEEEMALMNAGTSSIFHGIQEGVGISLDVLFSEKINIRNKLDKQNFFDKRWLLLSNAGGSNPCAAYIDLAEVDRSKLVIDQTLYWSLVEKEEEAIYMTGLLNSSALSAAILDFQPQGGFGARHIHTIPYQIIPQYDENNEMHKDVVQAVRKLMSQWISYCEKDRVGKYLHPNSGMLNSRRRKLQTAIRQIEGYQDYELACNAVLGVAKAFSV